MNRLITENKKFHVETNGTIIPGEGLEITLKDGAKILRSAMENSEFNKFNWVVSPKLSNSHQEINERSLSYWADKDFCIFKFVICSHSDLDEVLQIINKFKIDKRKVYIAFEGTTLQSQLNTALVDKIVKLGFNFSPRLQILFWGEAKGK